MSSPHFASQNWNNFSGFSLKEKPQKMKYLNCFWYAGMWITIFYLSVYSKHFGEETVSWGLLNLCLSFQKEILEIWNVMLINRENCFCCFVSLLHPVVSGMVSLPPASICPWFVICSGYCCWYLTSHDVVTHLKKVFEYKGS